MAKRWVVGVVVLALLVVAVVLVRPGSQALDADLAVPTTQPEVTTAPTLPEESLVGPDELSLQTTVADVVVTADRIGPLRLGETREALAQVGWQFLEGTTGCTRLRLHRAGQVALSGWVVEGRLASAQLELTDLVGRSVPTHLEFDFGRPVPEATGFQQQLLVVNSGEGADTGSEVRMAERVVDDVTVVVSDLGTYGVRFVEVRTAAAADCQLDAAMLGASPLPTEQAVLSDFSRGMTDDAVGPVLSLIGSSADQLGSVETWGDLLPELTGSGCEVIEEATGDGGTTLFLLDGTVVGQRYVSTDEEALPEPAASSSDDVFEEVQGVLLRRATTSLLIDTPLESGAAAAPVRSGRVQHVAQLVPELDTAVVVVRPVLLELETGTTTCP